MAENNNTPAVPAAPPAASPTDAVESRAPPSQPQAEDSDPDFDDLDDVLDQFSANAPAQPSTETSNTTTEPGPTASGPGRPEIDALHLADHPLPEPQKPGETEEQFVERLSSEMSKLFSQVAGDAEVADQSPENLAKMGKELEEFTRHMEEQGVKPEDLLKAIMGEEEGTKIANVATAERDRRESEKDASRPGSSSRDAKTTNKGGASFESTIRQTMSRLNESDSQAKTATQESAKKSEEDMLAEMLRALDSGVGGSGGDDEGLSKMFLDMMQQLTQKSMLYEPMKELHDQYPGWLAKNQPPKVKKEDYERYQKQSEIVRDITNKFEEPGFRDEDEGCRQYIWNKMQDMQSQGAPPEELVKNPFPGTDFGAVPGLGGGGGGGDDEGCPTQ